MGLGLDLPEFIGQLVSFLILLAVLSRFGYRPIRRVMEERAARIRESVEQASLVRTEYERAKGEADRQLEEARREAHHVLLEAGIARDAMLQEAREEARQRAQAIIDESREQIHEERATMVEALRREFAEAAIAVAESIVSETIDASKHRTLIARALDEQLPLERR